ncbi:Oxygen-independent coproporphyrinogen-III oxidase [Raoultella terrigena]|uniref:Oxygen-independent coproporphyrinogen-III oxidase n=1 Tax=Raoultella terrigena TaxID=577 RepID=A0A485CIY6_RAOTE|nr:Oxygen-independent coproporphyrinogen-III oxidase [Raoultella terrigena]
MANLPPLSLYIHIPWCVQKCPYCDFNSHALKGEVPHDDYVQHLLNDLRADAHYAQGREIRTIFIGGGTPSLLSGPAMQTLLDGVRACLPLAADAEITMEANPGTVEADRFVEYQRAGSTGSPSACKALAKQSCSVWDVFTALARRNARRIWPPASACAASTST